MSDSDDFEDRTELRDRRDRVTPDKENAAPSRRGSRSRRAQETEPAGICPADVPAGKRPLRAMPLRPVNSDDDEDSDEGDLFPRAKRAPIAEAAHEYLVDGTPLDLAAQFDKMVLDLASAPPPRCPSVYPGFYSWGPDEYTGECTDYRDAHLLATAVQAKHRFGSMAAVATRPMFNPSSKGKAELYDDARAITVDLGRADKTTVNLTAAVSPGGPLAKNGLQLSPRVKAAIAAQGWGFDAPPKEWRLKHCPGCKQLIPSTAQKCHRCGWNAQRPV